MLFQAPLLWVYVNEFLHSISDNLQWQLAHMFVGMSLIRKASAWSSVLLLLWSISSGGSAPTQSGPPSRHKQTHVCAGEGSLEFLCLILYGLHMHFPNAFTPFSIAITHITACVANLAEITLSPFYYLFLLFLSTAHPIYLGPPSGQV